MFCGIACGPPSERACRPRWLRTGKVRGALWSSGVADIHLRVVRAGEVKLSVHMDDHNTLVHEGELEVGVHAWSVAVPDGTESVTVRMACEGHRTERRL